MKNNIITRGLQLAKELNSNPVLAREVGLTIEAATVGHILEKVECPKAGPCNYVDMNHVSFEETKEDMVRKLGGQN